MSIVVESLRLGPAQAPTVMVKDTIDVRGCRTRAGSRALEMAPPARESAEVVQRLLAAGWQINGKTNLHELAFGTTGINHWTGTADNPRYPGRIPGGSSSGSAAAVAAGLCDAALGTDTGGSVRIPAACCGVFGLKPTFGRISRSGVMPAQTTLDCVGVFAASMTPLQAVMTAICPDFSAQPAADGVTIGVLSIDGVHTEIQAAVSEALTLSGFALTPVSLPGMDAAYAAGMTVINRESWLACRELVATGLVGDDVTGRLLAASRTSDEELAHAEQVRAEFSAATDRLLASCSVLALPTMPDYPLPAEEAADTRALLGMTSCVRPFNLSGHPAISIPLTGASGLPAGLQLVAAKGADEQLCAVAEVIARRCHSNKQFTRR